MHAKPYHLLVDVSSLFCSSTLFKLVRKSDVKLFRFIIGPNRGGCDSVLGDGWWFLLDGRWDRDPSVVVVVVVIVGGGGCDVVSRGGRGLRLGGD